MRRFWMFFLVATMLWTGTSVGYAEGRIRVTKALVHYLDLNGKHTLSPSPFERDCYQAILRLNREKCSTMCFDIQWRNTLTDFGDDLTITVEARAGGVDSEVVSVTQPIRGKKSIWSHWTRVKLSEEDFERLQTVSAWRILIRDGNDLVEEFRSFMWDPRPNPALIR